MQAQRSYRWLFLGLALFGLAADQASKYGVFRWLHNGGRTEERGAFRSWTDQRGEYDIVPGWFKFTAEFDPTTPLCDCGASGLQTWSAPVMPRVNKGALFGIGGHHKELANNIFAGVSVLAALAILVWGTRRSTSHDRWLSIALGLILGGTIGNFYDRIVFGGVRDFLHCYYDKHVWPDFNIADCCLVCGAGVLLVHSFFVTEPAAQPAPAEPAVAAAPAEVQASSPTTGV